MFYQGLSQEGARTLAELSDDVQAIRTRLEPEVDLSAVRPLFDWLLQSYGDAIADPSTLHSAFVTNRAYAGLKAPVREVTADAVQRADGGRDSGQFVPDFRARYLAEDVPFGLAVSRAIAKMADVQTPTMDRVIAWAGAGWARIIWAAMQVRLASHKHMGWTAWTNCFLLQLKPKAGSALRERME